MGANVTLLSPAEKTIGVRAQLIFLSRGLLDEKEINCDLTPIVYECKLKLQGLRAYLKATQLNFRL